MGSPIFPSLPGPSHGVLQKAAQRRMDHNGPAQSVLLSFLDKACKLRLDQESPVVQPPSTVTNHRGYSHSCILTDAAYIHLALFNSPIEAGILLCENSDPCGTSTKLTEQRSITRRCWFVTDLCLITLMHCKTRDRTAVDLYL